MAKNSKTIERKNYAKTATLTDVLPYLVEVQTKSFDEFIEKGVEEVFKEIFPIKSNNGDYELSVVNWHFEEPKNTVNECKHKNLDYARSMKVKLMLRDCNDGTIETNEVFLGNYPWMTEAGTFIIKGVERVVISQLVRSPGAYFDAEKTATNTIFEGDIIPSRGTWLQFMTDAKNAMWVKINRGKKVDAITFLRALGLTSKSEFTKLFGNADILTDAIEADAGFKLGLSHEASMKEALKDIYSKMKSGEPYTPEAALTLMRNYFFDEKKYDLLKAGRFKLKKKLGVYNRLTGHYLAEDLVDVNGEVIYPAKTLMTKEIVASLMEQKIFENGAHTVTLNWVNGQIEDAKDPSNCYKNVQVIKIYKGDTFTRSEELTIVGIALDNEEQRLTIPDVVATFSYYMNIMEGVGNFDDIDHLSNRRIRTVGELLHNQFKTGLVRFEKYVKDHLSISDNKNKQELIKSVINQTPIVGAIKEFFSTNPLSQFMDQTNPLSELTNKRRLSALGTGGLSRDRAGMEVRDVHFSHYGRICPIETPEGPNIGLINNLCCYAKVDQYGFIETPYRKVDKKTQTVIDGEYIYLSADEELDKVIAQANITLDEKNHIVDEKVNARYQGDNVLVHRSEVDYVDVSPKQIVSVAAACIPFLENDDGKRALMGANMQRQAIPLLRPEAPYVGTGMEGIVAHDSGLAIVAEGDGMVTYVDCKKIVITNTKGEETTYELAKFARSNQGTSINQSPIVKVGQKVKKDDIIADGPAMQNGELALGQNVTVAFMTWDGYNFEDAVIMSDRLVKDDTYTSIHIEEYDIDFRKNDKIGDEVLTRDVPNISNTDKAHLDIDGIVTIGTRVKEGDILVGRITPKGQSEPSAEEKLLAAIFGEKVGEGKDTSLRVPHGGAGTVLDVKILSRENKDELPHDVLMSIKVFVAQKRKISEGDKMAGRHGNKGVISKIVPAEDMPYLADGTPIDIMLNPLGVPSRMNIGQVLELHLGMAARELGFKVATPVFDGCSLEELKDVMDKAGLDPDGKTILYDGRTGEPFDERISVGVMYMIKLAHMVDDKLHARATGPYSLVTQQPLGGKAQNGGQRFGEMEVWALEAYGAAHTLQEILTLKSDDMIGRQICYKAILEGKPIPNPGIPESFRVLQKEMQGLGMSVKLYDEDDNLIDLQQVARDNELEQRRIGRNEEKPGKAFNVVYDEYGEEVYVPIEDTVAEDSYED